MPDSNIGGLNPITALEIDRVNDRLVAWDASATDADRTKRLSIVEHGVLAASPNHQTFSNAAATIAAGTTYLAQIGTMSAARAVTVPLANSVPVGFVIQIADESGTVTEANKITLARSGSDTINGVTSIDAIATARGTCLLISNGSNSWYLARFQPPLAIASQSITFNNQAINGYGLPYITIPGTSLELSASHAGFQLLFTATTAITVTYPVTPVFDGFNCILRPVSTGQITCSGSDFKNSSNQFKSAAQFAPISISKATVSGSAHYYIDGHTSA